MHRRRFLQASGATIVAAAGLASVGSVAAGHFDEVPQHVSLTFPEDWLKAYRPSLVLDQTTRDRLIGLYGWRASSPEFEYDWACWWMSYTHQTGVSDYDSHFGDHEPFYVGVDKDTGDVAVVAYSGYHWLKAQNRTPVLDGQHPVARVNNPYHHYLMDPVTTSAPGELFEPRSLVDAMPVWLDNGLEDELDTNVGVARPEYILSDGDWWAENEFGFSWNATYVNAIQTLGLHDAAQSDLGGGFGFSWPLAVQVVKHVHANPELVSPRLRQQEVL